MNKKLLLGIGLGIVLIYFSVRGIDFNETIANLKKVHLGYAGLSLFFILFMQALRSYRWGVILQPMEKISQFTLFAATSVGFLAIAAIPARIGELARPYLIAKKSSIKMSSALGTVVVERVLDSLTVLAITVAVVILQKNLPNWMITSGIIFFILTLFMIAFVLGLVWRKETTIKIVNRILRPLPGKLAEKADKTIRHFIDGFQVITDVKRLLYLLFLSAVVWLVDIAAIYALFLAFGFDLPILAAFVVMVFLIAGIAIPTPGFMGTWHAACILGLSLFSIARPESLPFALVYHFLAISVVIILGMIFLPFNKFSLDDMTKQMGENQVPATKVKG